MPARVRVTKKGHGTISPLCLGIEDYKRPNPESKSTCFEGPSLRAVFVSQARFGSAGAAALKAELGESFWELRSCGLRAFELGGGGGKGEGLFGSWSCV